MGINQLLAKESREGKESNVCPKTVFCTEQKFIHNGGKVGHIEDVAVDSSYFGKKIAFKVMKYLLQIAKDRECYKTILNCTDDVMPFYEKLGFHHTGISLRFDHA